MPRINAWRYGPGASRYPVPSMLKAALSISKNDFPIISIISKKKIPQDDDSLNILTLEDSVYVTDKLTKQIFKFSLREEETLIIQFKDSFGVGNSIYLNKLS